MKQRTETLRKIVDLHHSIARDFAPTPYRDDTLAQLEMLFECVVQDRVLEMRPRQREKEEA